MRDAARRPGGIPAGESGVQDYMTKRMLIDATHAEETRVVVLDGNRLEDFDVETQAKRQLKGNIYLAKVVRVEPSLQAAFVEYGGNRHGFLAFGEIHPDYYQIPVADRQRLLAMQAEEARHAEEEEDRAAAEAEAAHHHGPRDRAHQPPGPDQPTGGDAESVESVPDEPSGDEAVYEDRPDGEPGEDEHLHDEAHALSAAEPAADAPDEHHAEPPVGHEAEAHGEPSDDESDEPSASHALPAAIETDTVHGPVLTDAPEDAAHHEHEPILADHRVERLQDEPPVEETASEHADEAHEHGRIASVPAADVPPPETVGGEADAAEDQRDRRPPPKFLRNYKIQEVIKRRQILLVQVVKEERGTKGAALTTYLSLAGRYCVLMPNSPRGGGISRKITSAADRKRLKDVVAELDIPDGMGLIVRTAGANRPKPEIKRDCEYLMRLWDDIRDLTMKSTAAALIYEEASLIKRAIRDVYARDIDEIIVDGEEGWKAARSFMSMLMPTHARKVQLYKDGGMPLFAKHQVDAQLDAMLSPTVQLRSGGYLVINQAEALVAIDVNSGRSTRERNIEETALRTNLEAADEVARQLRLRDLAGLIVIDFIDMESKKHNAMVERRMKDALKHDRARIQVGHISHFGLLEMSRQRLRPSLAETSFIPCPQCGGTGHVRGTESAAIHVLRHVEEEGAKRRAAEIVVHVATPIALYLLNNKRDRLREIEARYAMRVVFSGDDSLLPPEIRIDRVRAQTAREEAAPVAMTAELAASLDAAASQAEAPAEAEDEEDDDEETEASAEADAAPVAGETPEEADHCKRRRRRRRRGGGRRDELTAETTHVEGVPEFADAESEASESEAADEGAAAEEAMPGDAVAGAAQADEQGERRRRRSRRGGRNRRPEGRTDAVPPVGIPGADQPDIPAVPYFGPTPANPFGPSNFDIFDVLDQAHVEPSPRPATRPEPESFPPPTPVRGESAPEEVAEHDVASPEPLGHEANEPDVETLPVASTQDYAYVPMEESQAHVDAEAAAAVRAASPLNGEAPAAEPPAPEPAPAAPAIQPVIIAGEPPPAERKRGWWRR